MALPDTRHHAQDATAPPASTATHCPYCSLQCGMHLAPSADGGLEVRARDFPTNRGGLCQKGWTAAALLDHPDRLTAPLVRRTRDAPLEPASWDEALDHVAAAFARVAAAHGRDAVGVFGGGGLTNEKGYTLGKFTRVALRSKSIDYNGRFCMSSAATAGQKAFGLDRGLPFPLADIGVAETLLLVGSNLAETAPPAATFLDEQADRGTLIVVDPRATPTARRADLHLQIVPGTDLALANGLLHVAMREGLVDEAYIAERTSGWDRVRQRVGAYWPDRVERICGVSVEDLRRTAHALAEGSTAIILTARGPEQQSNGTDATLAFVNLALALGLPGRPGSGYGTITGQGNGQGGREHGQKADQLPGYRRIDDPDAREHVAAVWGVEPEDLPGPGVSAWEMIDAFGTDDGVRALLVAGSNLLVSAPDSGTVRERLGALDTLVVLDPFLSETAALADVVLPVTQWAEETGTLTNLEGRVILRRRAQDPPDGVRSDLRVLSDLARRLDSPVVFDTDPARVFVELGRASAGGKADYAGITHDRIAAEDGVFWPCPSAAHPGTPRLFLDRFATLDGRAVFHPVGFRAVAEKTTADYPLFLTTGRTLRQYQSGTQTRRIAALEEDGGEPWVELHPVLARRHGIEEHDEVRLRSRRGEARARARLTPDIRRDTVFMPFHFGGAGRANLLTSPALDPFSRMPEFKLCAVRIDRAEPADPDHEVLHA